MTLETFHYYSHTHTHTVTVDWSTRGVQSGNACTLEMLLFYDGAHSGLTLIALLLSHNRPGKWLLRFYGGGGERFNRALTLSARICRLYFILQWRQIDRDGKVYCGGVMQCDIFGMGTISDCGELWGELVQQCPFVKLTRGSMETLNVRQKDGR